jgi:hypothetical protein
VKFPTHAGRHAIGPGALDQYATRKRIACLGRLASYFVAGTSLRRSFFGMPPERPATLAVAVPGRSDLKKSLVATIRPKNENK